MKKLSIACVGLATCLTVGATETTTTIKSAPEAEVTTTTKISPIVGQEQKMEEVPVDQAAMPADEKTETTAETSAETGKSADQPTGELGAHLGDGTNLGPNYPLDLGTALEINGTEQAMEESPIAGPDENEDEDEEDFIPNPKINSLEFGDEEEELE